MILKFNFKLIGEKTISIFTQDSLTNGLIIIFTILSISESIAQLIINELSLDISNFNGKWSFMNIFILKRTNLLQFIFDFMLRIFLNVVLYIFIFKNKTIVISQVDFKIINGAKIVKRILFYSFPILYFFFLPFIFNFSWQNAANFLVTGFLIFFLTMNLDIYKKYHNKTKILRVFLFLYIIIMTFGYMTFMYEEDRFFNNFFISFMLMIFVKLYMLTREFIYSNQQENTYERENTDSILLIQKLSKQKRFIKYCLNEKMSQNREKINSKTSIYFQQKIHKQNFSEKIIYQFLAKFYLKKKILIFTLELIVNALIILNFDFEYNTIGFVALIYITSSFIFKKFTIRFRILFYIFFPFLLILNAQIYIFTNYYLFTDANQDFLNQFYFLSRILIRKNNILKRNFYFILNILIYLLQKIYSDYIKNRDLEKKQPPFPSQPQTQFFYEILKYLFYILSYLFIYQFINHLISDENLINLITLIIFIFLLYYYPDDKKQIFKLILIYHSFLLNATFLYNIIDHELFSPTIENILGINFNNCFISDYSLYSLSPSNCDEFRNTLIMNLFFRINYYLLIRLSFLDDRIQHHNLKNKIGFIQNIITKFNIFIIILSYIYLSIIHSIQNIFLYMSAVVVIFLLVLMVGFKMYYPKSASFLQKSRIVFFILLSIHFMVTIFIYLVRLYLINKVDLLDEQEYNNCLNDNIFFFNLKLNNISTKQLFYLNWENRKIRSVNLEALKNVLLLISAWIFSQQEKILIKKKIRFNLQYITGIVYFLFFIFFCLNIFYFLYILSDEYILWRLTFILFIVFMLNYMLKIFYEIGLKFKFKNVLVQEIYIFENIFTKQLDKNYFSKTDWNTTDFNNNYMFLKHYYKTQFFNNLRNSLINLLLKYNCVYFILFSYFWSYTYIRKRLTTYQEINYVQLSYEFFILAILVVQIYLMKIVQKVQKEEKEKNYQFIQLLLKINSIIIKVIQAERANNFTEKINKYTNELKKFSSIYQENYTNFLFNVILSSNSKRDLLGKGSGRQIPKKAQENYQPEVENFYEYEDEESSSEDEYEEKSDDEYQEVRVRRYQQIEVNRLFEISEQENNVWTMNISLAIKIQYLPQNKKKVLLAKFMHCLFDVWKEVILNLLMLSTLQNVNWITIFIIIIVYGLRHIKNMKFLHIFTLFNISFAFRILALKYNDEIPFVFNYLPYFITNIIKVKNQNKEQFSIEIIALGSVSFLLIPTILLIKIVFDDFIKIDNNKEITYFKNIVEGKKHILEIDYQKWRQSGQHILKTIHTFIILKDIYIFPTILMLISIQNQKMFKFFLFYIIYAILYQHLFTKTIKVKKRIFIVVKKAYRIFYLITFLFLLYTALMELLSINVYMSQNMIYLLFLLNFQIIIVNSEFYQYNRQLIWQLYHLKNEMIIYLQNLSQNESFILNKIIGQVKYDKILSFDDNKKDPFFALNNLTQNNIDFFNKIFINDLKTRIPLKIYNFIFFYTFFKSSRFYYENIFFLLHVLKDKYSTCNLQYNTIDFLTMSYQSGFNAIQILNKFRYRIQNKKKQIVAKGIEILKEKCYEPSKSKVNVVEFSSDLDGISSPIDFIDQIKNIYNKYEGEFYNGEENFGSGIFRDKISDQYELVIKNYKYTNFLTTEGFLKYDFMTLFYSILMYVQYKIDKVIGLIFILNILLNYGFILVFIIYFFLFKILNEQGAQFKYRKTFFLIFGLISISFIKLFLNYLQFNNYQNNFRILTFLLGSNVNFISDLISIFILFILLNIYLNQWTRVYIHQKEFFGEACYRTILTNQIFNLGSKMHFKETMILDQQKKHLDQKQLIRYKEQIVCSMKFYLNETQKLRKNLIKHITSVFCTLKQFNQLNNHQMYEKSFYWRNFSFHNVSFENNQLNLKIAINIFFCIFNFYYFKFYKKQRFLENIKELSKDNNIEGIFLFNFTVALGCIIIEIIFANYQTMKWNQHIKINRRFTNEIIFQPNQKKLEMNVFKKIVHKIIYSLRLRDIYYQKQFNAVKYKHNSYFKKYRFNLCLFILFCFIFLIYMPLYNEEFAGFEFNYLFSCEIEFNVRIMLFMQITYLVICSFDNNIDKKDDYDSILNNNYDSLFNSIVYKIYMNIPFITEIRTVLMYISSKTSLDIFKWYKIEDIKRTLINAYYIRGSIRRKKIGITERFIVKFSTSYLIIAGVFLLLVSPLFFFSNLNFLVNKPVVQEAEVKISLKLVNPVYQNFKLDLVKINYFQVDHISLENFIETNDNLSNENIKYLQKEFSQGLYKLQSKLLSSEIYDYNLQLFNKFQGSQIQIVYSMDLKTDQYQFHLEEQIQDITVEDDRILEFLSLDCNQTIQNQLDQKLMQKFFSGHINSFYETNKTGKLQNSRFYQLKKKIYLKAHCSFGKKYHSINFFKSDQLVIFIGVRELGGEYYLKKLDQTSNTVNQKAYSCLLSYSSLLRCYYCKESIVKQS